MTTHSIRRMIGGERSKLTQEQFADRYGISVATVKNWDARGTMPDYIFEMLSELCFYRELYINMVKRQNEELVERFEKNVEGV